MSRLPIVCADADVAPDVGGLVSDPVPLAARGQAGYPGWLADRQGRRLQYLRLSVTDRCDLRCQYCMPAEGVAASPREDVLTFEEIVRVVRVFERMGVRTVRLTGGEPLVRKNMPDLVRMIRDEVGITDIALTTNATALEHVAQALVDAGLARMNVSLDSVDPQTFAQMTRGGDLTRVMRGIESALEAGIGELKTNSVVVRDSNDHQLGEVVDWAWDRGITPRFIELMPLGEGARLGRDAVVPVVEMKAHLADRIESDAASEYRLDRGPAGYVHAAHRPDCKVGFIGAVTDNFCQRCNRVRITARGDIRACLASPTGFSLRDLVRAGAPDDELVHAVEEALYGKREGHEFYEFGVDRHHAVNMSGIGG